MLTDTEKAALERAAADMQERGANELTLWIREPMLADAATLRALIERAGWQPIKPEPDMHPQQPQ